MEEFFLQYLSIDTWMNPNTKLNVFSSVASEHNQDFHSHVFKINSKFLGKVNTKVYLQCIHFSRQTWLHANCKHLSKLKNRKTLQNLRVTSRCIWLHKPLHFLFFWGRKIILWLFPSWVRREGVSYWPKTTPFHLLLWTGAPVVCYVDRSSGYIDPFNCLT